MFFKNRYYSSDTFKFLAFYKNTKLLDISLACIRGYLKIVALHIELHRQTLRKELSTIMRGGGKSCHYINSLIDEFASTCYMYSEPTYPQDNIIAKQKIRTYFESRKKSFYCRRPEEIDDLTLKLGFYEVYAERRNRDCYSVEIYKNLCYPIMSFCTTQRVHNDDYLNHILTIAKFDLKYFKYIMSKFKNISQTNCLLERAAMQKNMNFFKCVLEFLSKRKIYFDYSESYLSIARHGTLEMFKYVYERTKEKRNILGHMLFIHNRTDLLNFLVERKETFCDTSTSELVFNSGPNVCEFLKKHGGPKTRLYCAIKNNDYNLARKILQEIDKKEIVSIFYLKLGNSDYSKLIRFIYDNFDVAKFSI